MTTEEELEAAKELSKDRYINLGLWRRLLRIEQVYLRGEEYKHPASQSVKAELIKCEAEEELIAQVSITCEKRLQSSRRLGLREMLITRFADCNGKIVGKDASIGLVEIGYFPNRKSADASIYTALSKKPFSKLGKGIYQFNA